MIFQRSNKFTGSFGAIVWVDIINLHMETER